MTDNFYEFTDDIVDYADVYDDYYRYPAVGECMRQGFEVSSL